MSAQELGTAGPTVGTDNDVRLLGRVSLAPEVKVLPSGDSLTMFRVVVERGPQRRESRQTVDALECVVWSGRVKRSVGRWSVGDVVQVEGSLRRRFYTTPGGTVSRVEVEVRSGRLIRRAAS